MSVAYAAEKLAEAVDVLALSPGRIKDRLEEITELVMRAAVADDIPADLRTRYESICARLNVVNLRQMPEQDACDLARQILDIASMAEEASKEATMARPAVESASRSELEDMFVSVARRMAKLGMDMKPAIARSREKVVHVSEWLLVRLKPQENGEPVQARPFAFFVLDPRRGRARAQAAPLTPSRARPNDRWAPAV
jgi:hypothetical protein